MGKIRKQRRVEQSCLELAQERVRLCYDRFDKIVVSFSGGKDSTCVLHIALDVATELGCLPLDVYTFDEEAIPPETVEYMARIAAQPSIRFHWYCLPIQHRNACSRKEPFWYPWDPCLRERWVRDDYPPGAISTLAGHVRQPIPECTPLIWGIEHGSVCNLMGIRCQESQSRYQAIAGKSDPRCYLSRHDTAKHLTHGYPIYDWRTEDVWRAPDLFGWDYNRAYDVMEKAGVSWHDQRCAPPYGEQPIHGLWKFKICWPELWDRMTRRVHGAATAARYANTGLYGTGAPTGELLPGETWRKATHRIIASLTDESQAEVMETINACRSDHYNRAHGRPMPDEEPDHLSGYSWLVLHQAALIGGNKFNRTTQKLRIKALNNRKAYGN